MPHESNTNPQLTAENSVIYSDIPNEAQQTIYGVTLPDGVTVEANIHTPVDYQGKKYIRIGEHIYQVHHDAGRDVWCIYHGDNPIKPALAVHYEDGGWKLQNTGALPGGIPERPDSTTPRYAELSILTLEQLNKESQKINEEYGKIIRDTRQLVEDIKTEIETQHLKLAIEQVKGGGLNGQLDAAKNVVTAFSALAGVDRSIIDRFEQNYQALEGRKQQLDNANSELVNRWKSYRKWESDTVQQMQTLEPHSIARIQGHIENNNAVDPSKHPASKPGISATGDITGAHMKDSFMQAVTAHGAKIVGYRTYAHAPGVIQVSYLMPGDAGYGDVTPPVNNGLAVPVLPATTAGVAGLPPQAISPLEQIGSGHPAWHIYDSSGPYAPSCAPTTASRSTPRLKTIFDPNTAGSIVTDINQYMGYVRETLATLGNLNLLRADQMRYNVPVPSLTSDAGDIRMVMYFSKEADPKNPSLHHIKPSSAYINVNSPAMASAYTDVVSNGLPVTENAPADLGNQLLKNPLDLHNFVTAIRGTAVTSVKNGTTGESSKWLFQLDAAASSSMKDLFLQNPHHSELMLWNADNTAADTRHRSLKWNGQSLVVNEVPMTATGNSLKLTVVVNPGAGGRDIEALKTNFSKLLNNLKGFGRDTRVDIELVGCSVEHIYSSDSNLIKQLTSELLPLLDVNPGLREKLTFTTRQYAQRTADGGGQEVYVPTRGWIADTGILADNEKYKSTWRYDSKERQMVSEVQPHKLETFKGVVDKLYKGQVTVEQLTPEDKQLVLLFMDDDQIKALSGAESSKNQDGLRLYQVVITLAEQYASATEGIFDGKAAFNAAMAQTDAVKLPGSLSGTVAYGTERWKFNGEARNSEHLQTFEEEVKGKLATPDTPQDTDGNETRWVIQLQGDDVSSNAASALFLKHPANSELILWDREKTTTKKWDPSSKRYVIIENGERHQSLKWAPQSQKLVRSTISPPGGRLKILFVGHGRRTGSGEHGDLIFAERGIELWKTDFSAMLDSIKKGNVTHIDVTLVGCTLIDEHAPQNGLPQQLADLLLARGREFGIAPENLSLSARQHYIRVQPDGRKEAYIDGEWRPTGAGMEDGEYKHVWRYDRDTGKMETRTTQHSPVFYRTDRRSREQIQADGGFKPWDKHFTLEHAREFIKFFIGDKHVTEADIKNNPKYTKNGQNMLMPLIGVKPNLIELSRIIRYTVSGVTPWVCAATNTDTGGRVAGTAGGIYKISIPTTENLRAFEMAGGQLRRLDQDWRTYTKPLLLLNADSIDTATIIAFTHGIGSKAEVTFFTSIPSDNISLFFVESDVANTLGDTQGKAQWKWKHETNLQKLEESIKKKFTLADTRQNAGESQWIIQLQGDATTSDTTGDLFLKHPAHSELILWDTSAAAGEMNNSLKWDSQRQTLVRGPVVAPQGKLNICFVGHGADSNSDAVFGGHSPDVWKSNFSKLLAAIPQGVTHINITFVGYRRVDDTSPESRLPQQLSDMLLARGKALGIAPEHVSLSTQQHDMRIMPDGRKEMYIPGEGWISGENVIAENERHRYVWHHDSATGTMVSEIGLHRLTAFREVVERLWAGQVFFHELLPTEQQLVLRFLEAGEITALSQKSKDGEVLHQAIKELVKRHNPDVGIIDGKAALHAILDAENAAWHKLAQELGISVDTQADTEAGRAVFDGMHQLRQQGGDKGSNGKVPADSYTEKAMGLRFRVMYKLQTFVERAGKGVLALGSVAAICRIKVINDRLASEKLSDEDASKLRTERAFAISELGVDLSDEAVGFLQSKWGIQISRTGAGAATSATVPQSSGLTLGTRMTRGLRAFGPGVASTLLSAAGTALAWYGVSRAIEELQEFKKGELAAIERGEEKQFQDRVTQMRVNLGVNIATAIISTVLTVGSATAFITGLVGAGSLAAMAAASFMAVAGPVGGALLVGAFIGLWIYNGIKTVEEFSRHMKLDAWDKFRLGAGSIFGAIPAELQRDLDVSKLRQAVERARQLEISGTFDRLPEVKTIYHVMPEIIPGTVYTKISEREVGGADGCGIGETREIHEQATTAPQTYQRVIDINMDTSQYMAVSSDGSRVQLNPDEFISVRKTREELINLPEMPWLKLQGLVFFVVGPVFSAQDEGYLTSISNLHHYLTNFDIKVHQHIIISHDGDKKQNMLVLTSNNPGTTVSLFMTHVLHNFAVYAVDSSENMIFRGHLNNALSSFNALEEGIFIASETGYLTLFRINENTNELFLSKYREKDNGGYELHNWLTQPLPIQLPLQSNRVFFQDLTGDGLADLMVVNENGSLQVARQKQDGNFVLTDEFVIYRAKATDGSRENLSFSGHKILGFRGTARTLYSQDSNGKMYSYTVVSKADMESQLSLVKLNIGTGSPDGKADQFIASSRSDAGDFIFQLGGGRAKQATGGVNKDSFILLDEQTHCTLNGNGGADTLDFNHLSQEKIQGVTVNARDGKASLKLKEGRTEERVSFSNIENITGTRGDDELTGDDNDNILDGVDGMDTLNAGAGNDMLKGVYGTFNGGQGIDYYQLRRLPTYTLSPRDVFFVIDEIDLIEDYSLGEDSHVNLDYRIDEINSMTIEEGKHLIITLNGHVHYRLHNFYANTHAGADNKKTSSWEFTTKDGFRFRLKTAASPPASGTALSGIPVFFQGTLTDEERAGAWIILYASDKSTRASVKIFETVAGQNVIREIVLPSLFELKLHHNGTQGVIRGSDRSEHLTGSGNVNMAGRAGADTYLIKDAKGGFVTIDNTDTASVPEQDSLILPWALSETMLSAQGSNLLLSRTSQPGSHMKVHLCDFMTKVESRHLTVSGTLGLAYRLDITQNGVAYLASGSLTLDKENWLEVFSASQGGLVLDGRRRDLSTDKEISTVMIDRSARGNDLYGTQDVRNYLQVTGGDNRLYGSSMADVLQGGTGNDHMEGKEGNDVYYVNDSATIEDTGGEDILILTGVDKELLCLEKTWDSSLQMTYGRARNRKKVVVKDFFNPASPGNKIEHIVANGAMYVINNARLIDGDMDNLVSAMGSMPTFDALAAMQSNPLLTGTLARGDVLTSSVGLISVASH